jgi:hypothetical protein
VPLQGSLAVAGRRGAESWGGVSHASEPGLQGVHTLPLQGLGGASESSPSVDPLQGNLGVATGWRSPSVDPLQGNLGVATG